MGYRCLEKYGTMADGTFKYCVGALLVYEIGNKESFQHIPKWMKICKENSPKNVKMVLVGNKCDLADDKRQVSLEEGKKFAEENEMLFLETSAKTETNVEKLFLETVKQITRKTEDDTYDTQFSKRNTIKIGRKEKEEEKVNGKKKILL